MTVESAQARGWGPGWPTDRSADMTRVHAGGITITVHKRVAKLVGWLLDETVRHGYRLDKTADDWGYASRPIRGSSTPSNHSWGLAVDLNSTQNPMQTPLVTDMPEWMVYLWESHGFRWGGRYSGRKDSMHYEFMGIPADADRITAELGPKPAPPPVPQPTTEDDVYLRDNKTGQITHVYGERYRKITAAMWQRRQFLGATSTDHTTAEIVGLCSDLIEDLVL